MVRWEPGAAERLQSAAMELFAERGFAAVTVPDITRRAGLTTRTYFRYFSDKREVLFTGEDGLPELAATIFAEADPQLTTLEVIVQGLTNVIAPRFDGLWTSLRARREIVRSDEGLRERELRKVSIIAEVGAAGFRQRGLTASEADLAARLAAMIYDASLTRWLDQDSESPLADIIRETARNLTALAFEGAAGERAGRQS
jgi:AcrR family transcriptional regulator